MADSTFIKKCTYCGGEEIGIGYQLGYGSMLVNNIGFKGSKVIYEICINCGSILHSKVSDPKKFKPKK